MSDMKTIDYRPEVDGLRAIAIVTVIFFHVGLHGFEAGYVGVDIFFVISGYLITSIIYKRNLDGKFSYLVFYDSRVRRILPALYFMLSIVTFISWLHLSPNDAKDYYQSLFATIAFGANILFFIESSDYFGLSAEYKPLLHMWSLSLEEQFYFIYPLALIFFLKFKKNHLLFLLLLTTLSLLLMIWAQIYAPSAGFYLLPMRSWELLLGGVAALSQQSLRAHVSPSLCEYLGILGLLMLVASIFPIGAANQLGLIPIAPALGSALILIFTSQTSFVGKLLGSRPFVGIGLISYSLYLYHQPIIVFAKYYRQTPLEMHDKFLILGLTFVCGFISWSVIEQRFKKYAQIRSRYFYYFVFLCSSIFLALGLLGHMSEGFKAYKIEKIPEVKKFAYVDHQHEVDRKKIMLSQLTAKASLDNHDSNDRKVLIIGDSVATDFWAAVTSKKQLFPSVKFSVEHIDDIHMSSFLDYMEGRNHNGKNKLFNESYLAVKEKIYKADDVVLTAAWDKNTVHGGIALAKFINNLAKKVYIVGAFKTYNMADSSYYFATSPLSVEQIGSYYFDKLAPDQNSINLAISSNLTGGIKFINKSGFFCSDIQRVCRMYNAHLQPLLHDEVHLTVEGVSVFGEALSAEGYWRIQ